MAEQSYTDYPKAASENAQRALNWAEENGWGTCLEATGKQRANQLAKREPISRETISRMASFKRHQQHKDVPYSEGCGGLAWDAWGGTEGIEWAIRKLKQIDNQNPNAMIEANILGVIEPSSANTRDAINSALLEASGQPVVLNISSEGGDVFEGLSMADLISSYPGEVTAKGIGIVASIATVVMLAADKSLMSKNGFFMIHNCWGMSMGNKEEMQKMIDLYEKVDEQMLNIYVAKIKNSGKLVDGDIKKTKKMVAEMMTAETWMTAQEALNYGFIDGYIEEQPKDKKLETLAFASLRPDSINKFKNIPKKVKLMNENKSLVEKIALALGLSVRAEEIEIEKEISLGEEKKNEELDDMDKVVEEKDKMIEELTKRLAELETKMGAMTEQIEGMTKEKEEVMANALAKTVSGKVENNAPKVKSLQHEQIHAAGQFVMKQILKR
jgi:ATP-dependent protease ClpP protease subunit